MKGNQEISFERIVRMSPAFDAERADLLCRCEDIQAECDCANSTISKSLDAADELIELARDLVVVGSQLMEVKDGTRELDFRDLDDLSVQATDSARTLIELALNLIHHD